MAELTAAEASVDYDGGDFEIDAPPTLTKATDVFAFSMVALVVSGLSYFGMFFGILCEWWLRLTSL
jgi:hypothetical protein